jgi:hypothetical protein
MKKPLAVLVLVLAAACGQKEASQSAASEPPPVMPQNPPSASTNSSAAAMSHDMMPMDEAVTADAPILRVRDLHTYSSSAMEAYKKAAEIPDRLDKMYCYCHCHEHMAHRTLRTCFQTHHAEECNVCQKEAIIAWQDWKAGKSVEDSQRAADAAFNGGVAPPVHG